MHISQGRGQGISLSTSLLCNLTYHGVQYMYHHNQTVSLTCQLPYAKYTESHSGTRRLTGYN